MHDVSLPCLKVYVHTDGRLDAHYKPPAFEPIDEGWWLEVLFDPRASVPHKTRIEKDERGARYRLDRQKEAIVVTCECGHAYALDRNKMIAQFGPSMNVLYMVRELMPCDRHKFGACRAYVCILS